MERSLINDYLNDLHKNLTDLKKEDRQDYVKEFNDHIHSLVDDSIENGLTEEEAQKVALKQFPEPKILAKKYVEKDREKLVNDPFDKMDFDFRLKVGLIGVGFAQLISLILQEPINFYMGLIGLSMIVLGNIFLFLHKHWKEDNIKSMFWVRLTMLLMLPGVVFAFFLRDSFEYSSIIYVLSLCILLLLQLFAAQKLLRKVNRV